MTNWIVKGHFEFRIEADNAEEAMNEAIEELADAQRYLTLVDMLEITAEEERDG